MTPIRIRILLLAAFVVTAPTTWAGVDHPFLQSPPAWSRSQALAPGSGLHELIREVSETLPPELPAKLSKYFLERLRIREHEQTRSPGTSPPMKTGCTYARTSLPWCPEALLITAWVGSRFEEDDEGGRRTALFLCERGTDGTRVSELCRTEFYTGPTEYQLGESWNVGETPVFIVHWTRSVQGEYSGGVVTHDLMIARSGVRYRPLLEFRSRAHLHGEPHVQSELATKILKEQDGRKLTIQVSLSIQDRSDIRREEKARMSFVWQRDAYRLKKSDGIDQLKRSFYSRIH